MRYILLIGSMFSILSFYAGYKAAQAGEGTEL